MSTKPSPRDPVGRFQVNAWGRPFRAILDRDLTWTAVPLEQDGSEQEAMITTFLEGALNGVYGQHTAQTLLSGVRGVKYVQLFHQALADLQGTDGQLLQPRPDPPGTVH